MWLGTKIRKWRRWHSVIAHDLHRLRTWRVQWQALAGDPDTGPDRRLFVEEVYAHALAMGIRRQLKSGSRDVSMSRLLTDIATDAELLPRRAHGSTSSAADVRRDLADLRRETRAAEAFADRTVAHADRRAGGDLPLEILHSALERLEELHAGYATVLKG